MNGYLGDFGHSEATEVVKCDGSMGMTSSVLDLLSLKCYRDMAWVRGQN